MCASTVQPLYQSAADVPGRARDQNVRLALLTIGVVAHPRPSRNPLHSSTTELDTSRDGRHQCRRSLAIPRRAGSPLRTCQVGSIHSTNMANSWERFESRASVSDHYLVRAETIRPTRRCREMFYSHPKHPHSCSTKETRVWRARRGM